MSMRTTLACLLVMAAVARADEIALKNGDRLTGKVLDLAGGKLRVETPHSGVVSVDWAQVATIRTDAKAKIKLATGDLLEGKLSPGADGRLAIEVEGAAAPVEIAYSAVAAINEPPPTWHGSVDLAARHTDGNTHTTSALLAAEAIRATDRDVLLFRALFRYGETKNVITERNGYGLGKYDYLFTESIYGYVSGELLSDKFKDLTLRTVVSLGLGHIFVASPDVDFKTDVGFAYIDNDFRDAKDEAHAGGRISARLRVKLPLDFEFLDEAILYPNFEEGDDWQLRNDASLATALGAGWALKAGMITEYDNDPPDGRREHDNIYYIGLGYRF